MGSISQQECVKKDANTYGREEYQSPSHKTLGVNNLKTNHSDDHGPRSFIALETSAIAFIY